MKGKKIACTVLVVLLVLIVAALVFLLKPFSAAEMEGIQFEVVEGAVSGESLRYVLENKTDRIVNLSPEHSWFIEKRGLFGWRKVITKVESIYRGVPANALGLMPGVRSEKDWNWSYYYGSLPSGDYRLMVEFENSTWVAANFQIP